MVIAKSRGGRVWPSSAAAGQDTQIVVCGAKGAAAEMLEALSVLDKVPDGQVVDTVDQAQAVARRLLSG